MTPDAIRCTLNSGHKADTGCAMTATAKFDDRLVRELPAPASGNRITYDRGGKEPVKGFGIRVTAAGAKAFVLNYTIAGRERRLTIGGYPAWSVAAAREQAQRFCPKKEKGGGR